MTILTRTFNFQLVRTWGVLMTLVFVDPVKAQHTLTYSVTNNPTESLIVDLLKLGLQKSANPKSYELQESRLSVNEARKVQMLKDGDLDIIWMGTSKEYEQELHAIRIPILKGMLGHRIFIIRQGDQATFNKIQNLEQLRRVPLGQGKFWGDTAVLKQAGLKVVDPVKYESLFHMLEGERFDYFPRALHEPWSEVTSRRQLNLTVEQKHLLIYPFALYLFVAKNNIEVADILYTGLRRAIDDGSYDNLFYGHPVIKETLDKSQLEQRIIHRLNNPNMSAATPLNDTSLWLDVVNR